MHWRQRLEDVQGAVGRLEDVGSRVNLLLFEAVQAKTTLQAELDRHRLESSRLTKDSTTYKQQVDNLTIELARLRTTLTTVTEAKNQTDNRLTQLEADLHSSRQQEQKHQSELVLAQNELEAARTEVATTQHSLQQARREIVDSHNRLDLLLQDNEEKSRQFASRELQLHKLRARKYRLRLKARNRIKVLKHTLSTDRNQLNMYRRQLDQLQLDHPDLEIPAVDEDEEKDTSHLEPDHSLWENQSTDDDEVLTTDVKLSEDDDEDDRESTNEDEDRDQQQ